MARYIDADALQKSLQYVCTGGGKWGEAERMYIEAFSDFVDGCPTADVRENVHGKWKHGYCSECGYNWGKGAPIASVPNFCPNCGADMRERREDG